ncbi:MAG: hypothetical protein O3A51_11865 [Verrucomicrobia bacterium]|nr:hypothetical protein [Verrucomicrobiota bacterium]
MNHILAGCVLPFVIGVVCFFRSGRRASLRLLILTPFFMFLGATWAVLPDLPRTFGLAGFDHDISMNPIIDIFCFHYTINQHESYSPWFNMGFVGMLAALFWAAWRELRFVEEQ